jgi:hypothetical protein
MPGRCEMSKMTRSAPDALPTRGQAKALLNSGLISPEEFASVEARRRCRRQHRRKLATGCVRRSMHSSTATTSTVGDNVKSCYRRARLEAAALVKRHRSAAATQHWHQLNLIEACDTFNSETCMYEGALPTLNFSVVDQSILGTSVRPGRTQPQLDSREWHSNATLGARSLLWKRPNTLGSDALDHSAARPPAVRSPALPENPTLLRLASEFHALMDAFGDTLISDAAT